MPRGVVERWIHQHDIDTVRGQTRAGKDAGFGCDIENDNIRGNGIRGRVIVGKGCKRGIDFDEDKSYSANTRRERQARSPDARTQIGNAVACTGRGRRCQQHRVMAGAMPGLRLPQPQFTAEKCILNWPGSIIGSQFVGETRVDKNLARLPVVILMHQNPARQHA